MRITRRLLLCNQIVSANTSGPATGGKISLGISAHISSPKIGPSGFECVRPNLACIHECWATRACFREISADACPPFYLPRADLAELGQMLIPEIVRPYPKFGINSTSIRCELDISIDSILASSCVVMRRIIWILGPRGAKCTKHAQPVFLLCGLQRGGF